MSTLFFAVSPTMAQNFGARVVKSFYGTTSTGASIDQYTLTNAHGMEVTIITYGAIITSVQNPSHKMPDIVLGFNNLNDYETKNSPHFGATIGRYANRIANGVFSLKGVTYCLDANNGPNTLHGGFKGFDTKVWTATKVINDSSEAGVELNYLSPAGDGWTNTAPNPNCPSNAVKGFPGNLNTFVTFTLNNKDQITINYKATTDAPTVVNLTNHSYWNLSGEGTGTIYSDVVTLNANQFVPVNTVQIPFGTILPVAGTVLDFRRGKSVSTDIRKNDPQLISGDGYDLSWVVNSSNSYSQLNLAATVHDPSSNRTLTVWTDQPGVQFYSGNSLDASLYGTSNRAYRQSDALALETQHYPDSPNHPNFPSTVLLPNQTYSTTTIFDISGCYTSEWW
ncbi:MAG: aldose epimerase family protein [Edaphobacter sp.]